MRKAVLAYSGGLDTSVCIPLLREKYACEEVITVTVDVGQPASDLRKAELRAAKLSDKHRTIDAKEEFVEKYLFPLIKANGNYEGYTLGHAIARPLIARKVVEAAHQERASAVAHGCTGKGNDQLRFEAVFRASKFSIHAPMRELNMTRSEEIEYAIERGIDVPITFDKPYSIDENVWSRSIEGGRLEDLTCIPPADIYKWTTDPSKANGDELITLEFKGGVPVGLNERTFGGLELIQKLNDLGGKHGIGRTDMIEDRVLGLKAREIYEHPAATIIMTAHQDLEALVLTQKERKVKALIDSTWAELAYEGLLDEPLMLALDAFIDKTQERVTGTVTMRLYKGTATVVARSAPQALYSEELVSFNDKSLDQRDAEGFSKYHGFQSRMYNRFVRE
ncbi:MAG: argininosuccinate synthase [Euryarchaeota archaeon]|nr:argininosuccinate synthase [Euryarchaeota archaeon]